MTTRAEFSRPGNRLPANRPLLCAITDRKTLPGGDLAGFLLRAIRSGIDLVQLRERGLPDRQLLALSETAVEQSRTTSTRILINDRLDLALASQAAGVHLPVRGLPVAEVRGCCAELLIGVSTHSLEEIRRAEDAGADFAVFGPVFNPLSKSVGRPAVGLERLAEAVKAVSIPVLALGGITTANARLCLAAGAAGVAAITLFQASPSLADCVADLRQRQRPD